MNEIEIYKTENNLIEIKVHLNDESVWLNRQQLADLFNRDIKTIGKHITNIFKEKELDQQSVVAKFATTALDGKTYQVDHYNLDVIISVGYRVKSFQGTQFRIWATQRLKEHLIKGYTINQKRLDELQQTVSVIVQQAQNDELQIEEAKGLLEIISQYTHSFVLLNQFDSNRLPSTGLEDEITYEIDYDEAKTAVLELKKKLVLKEEANDLFGNEKDKSFEGILGNVIQRFGGQYLYPTIEEQAAHLLYFIIKNHPFSDGNKRIGAFLFIWFLERNKHRFKQSGELKINDNALVTLALLVAQSNPSDKDLMIQLIVQLIRKQ